MAVVTPPLVVLAGGLGTRLRTVTGAEPKALAPLSAGVPMLRHVLSHWRERGARRAILCLGYGAQAVIDAVGGWTDLGMDVTFSREAAPLGTGGAVRNALAILPEEFVVVNGDTIIDLPLAALLRWHRCREWAGSLVLHDQGDGDRVDVSSSGAIRAFAGRGSTGTPWIFAGIAVLRRSLFAPLPAGARAGLEADVLAPALAAGARLGGLRTRRPFHDLGTPERLTSYIRQRTL
jgi:NDP-sugar pyrophosphorylase family protein